MGAHVCAEGLVRNIHVMDTCGSSLWQSFNTATKPKNSKMWKGWIWRENLKKKPRGQYFLCSTPMRWFPETVFASSKETGIYCNDMMMHVQDWSNVGEGQWGNWGSVVPGQQHGPTWLEYTFSDSERYRRLLLPTAKLKFIWPHRSTGWLSALLNLMDPAYRSSVCPDLCLVVWCGNVAVGSSRRAYFLTLCLLWILIEPLQQCMT